MLKITSNIPDLQKRAKRTQQEIRQQRKELLNLLGTQVLSWAQQDYRKKARGQQGSDGITWAKLQRSTLEARVRRRAPARRIVERRRALAEKIAGTKGKKSGERKQKLREQRKAQLEKLKALVDREVGKHEIGVDTGLQRSSASPGFAGPDGKGGNEFTVNQNSVTVGYNREYSEYFDDKRAMLPETLPSEWQRKLDDRALKWMQEIARGEGGIGES